MKRNVFTKEQIEILQRNKYVYKVSETTITYTEDFKMKFIEKINKNENPKDILKELGFDTELLNKNRIKSIKRRCKLYATRIEGVKDIRKDNCNFRKPITSEREIKKLKEEIEFLKKITRLYMNSQKEKQI